MGLFLRNLLFTLLAPGTIGVYAPLVIARGRVAARAPALVAGVVLMVAGAALYVWCVYDFAVHGRGTPAPIDAPKQLVITGPYRHSRNPMYVAVLAIVLGWCIVFRSVDLLMYAVSVTLAFNLFVRLYEEPHLTREFGVSYEAYRSRVGRWLPRFAGFRERRS